jgi:hypothetical protein
VVIFDFPFFLCRGRDHIMQSSALELLPPNLRHNLAKLGADIAIARRKRNMTTLVDPHRDDVGPLLDAERLAEACASQEPPTAMRRTTRAALGKNARNLGTLRFDAQGSA